MTRSTLLALSMTLCIGCAGHRATADILAGVDGAETTSQAYVWQPTGKDNQDAFILVVTRGLAAKGETVPEQVQEPEEQEPASRLLPVVNIYSALRASALKRGPRKTSSNTARDN